MTQIFADGFESGDFSAWTGTSASSGCTIEVQNTNPHTGTYNAHALTTTTSSVTAYCYKTGTFGAITYARMYVKFYQINILTNIRIHLLDLVGTTTVSVQLRNNPAVWAIRAGASNYLGTHTPVTGQWYCIELKRDSTNGLTQLWVDGVVEVAETSVTITGNCTQVNAGICASSVSAVNELYVDCVVVSDAYIGPEVSSVLQTVTDSLSLNDALLRHKILAVSESIGAADAIAGRNKSPLLTFDSISLVDLACTGKQLMITDAMRINDFSSLPSRILKALDSIGISDDFTVQKTIIVNDNVSLVELAEAGAGGSKKTRLFLILGDLAIQLSGD